MLARLYNLFTWLMQSGNLDTSQSSSESTPRDTESEHVIQESSLDQSVEARKFLDNLQNRVVCTSSCPVLKLTVNLNINHDY